MSLTNSSYITDTSELKLFVNWPTVLNLVFQEGDGISPDPSDPPTGARLDRLYSALNWGKECVDAALTAVYVTPIPGTVSATNPPRIVKRWNAMFAMVYLYGLHIDRAEQQALQQEAVESNIEQYTKPGGVTIAGLERSGTGVAILGQKEGNGTMFDRGGYFDPTTIRSDEQDYLRGQS